MSKYKKGYTPEEAALKAVGLEEYKSIPQVQQLQSLPCPNQKEHIAKNKLISEAQDILNSLTDEVYLAYRALHSDEKKTDLVIYSEFYTDETQQGVVVKNTKLTKESIGLWFANIGEIAKANKFCKPNDTPPKTSPLNRFSKGFTAEHCALIATNLHHYSNLEQAMKAAEAQELILAEQAADAHRDFWYEVDTDPNLENNSINVAIELKEALLDELRLAYDCMYYENSAFEYAEIGCPQPQGPELTDIAIYHEVMEKQPGNNPEPDYENTTITKDSLAIWLWNNGHKDLATTVHDNIEKRIEKINTSNQTQSFSQTTAQKTETKTTRVPQESLIDSLGIMAWLLSKKHIRFTRGDKPNAKQIKEAVEEALAQLSLDDEAMISNLNKDITHAIKQIEHKLKE